MILLDTNVVVAFLNGDRSVLRRMRSEIVKIRPPLPARLIIAIFTGYVI